MIGYGAMGHAHAYAYAAAPRIRPLPMRPVLRVVSGRDAGAVERAASRYGAGAWVTDWREAIARDDVDIVDVCTPPGTHPEGVAAAAAARQAGLCQKPVAPGPRGGPGAPPARPP